MLVRALTAFAGAASARPGEIIEVDEGLAKSLITAGLAITAEKQEEKVEKPKRRGKTKGGE